MHTQSQEQLAEGLKEINELANDAFAAKVAETKAADFAKELKGKLCSLMETAGVDKISADACTVSGKMKASASVPKDDADKINLFEYLMSQDNLDTNGKPVVSHAIKELSQELLKYPTFFSMITINAAGFNSWYGKEQEKFVALGEVDWKLPFINTYEYYSIGMRKKATPKT